MRVIKATADFNMYIVDLDLNDIEAVHREIGGFECVRTRELHRFFGKPVVMIVDDDGFSKEKPLNIFASAFYQGDIVGDVLFVVEEKGEFIDFSDIDLQLQYIKLFLNI